MDKSDAGFLIQLHKEVKKINCKQHSHIEWSYCESLFYIESLKSLKWCIGDHSHYPFVWT